MREKRTNEEPREKGAMVWSIFKSACLKHLQSKVNIHAKGVNWEEDKEKAEGSRGLLGPANL